MSHINDYRNNITTKIIRQKNLMTLLLLLNELMYDISYYTNLMLRLVSNDFIKTYDLSSNVIH